MTANQIAYAKLQEDQRANLAREAETYRSNRAAEAENYRANTAREMENQRANTLNYQASIYASDVHKYAAEVSAGASYYSSNLNYSARMSELAESKRHSKEMEQQGNAALWQESAKQHEVARHNMTMESLDNRKTNQGGVSTVLNGVFGAIKSAAPLVALFA